MNNICNFDAAVLRGARAVVVVVRIDANGCNRIVTTFDSDAVELEDALIVFADGMRIELFDGHVITRVSWCYCRHQFVKSLTCAFKGILADFGLEFWL